MERPHRPRPARAGFTLIELLVAILIISALLALLVPTVAAAFRRAKEAQVSAEMNNLATALASFNNTYGSYPPSRMLLVESGYTPALLADTTPVASLQGNTPADPNASQNSQIVDITVGQLATRSLLYLRRFWPRVDFTGSSLAAGYFNDFNGNGGTPDAYYILSGSECLTFFLGGMPVLGSVGGGSGSGVLGTNGFSRSPTHPFVALDPTNMGTYYNPPYQPMNILSAQATNRTSSNYEFNNGRLLDQDGDHVPSYMDPFDLSPLNRRSYAYFAAYGTNAYDPNDVNGFGHSFSMNGDNWELEDSPGNISQQIYVERGFNVSFPPGSVVSPAPNPYTSGLPAGGTVAWINANSFQIISAGADRQWGLGGTFIPTATSSDGVLPILPKGSDIGDINNDNLTGVRNRESDNVTNFSAGRLQ